MFVGVEQPTLPALAVDFHEHRDEKADLLTRRDECDHLLPDHLDVIDDFLGHFVVGELEGVRSGSDDDVVSVRVRR